MGHVLDLTVTLTPPPEGAPEGAIAAIGLRCDALGLSHQGQGDVLMSPLTEEEQNALQWYKDKSARLVRRMVEML